MRMPKELRSFVGTTQWTFAKTYATTWPHEYIVRGRSEEDLFVRLAQHIHQHGSTGKFYDKSFTYFEEDGRVYWTMGEPIGETNIINRCKKEETYAYRLEHGTLPD